MVGSHVWVVDALRTPVGRHRGALAAVRPDDFAAAVGGAVLERANRSMILDGTFEPNAPLREVELATASGAALIPSRVSSRPADETRAITESS